MEQSLKKKKVSPRKTRALKGKQTLNLLNAMIGRKKKPVPKYKEESSSEDENENESNSNDEEYG